MVSSLGEGPGHEGLQVREVEPTPPPEPWVGRWVGRCLHHHFSPLLSLASLEVNVPAVLFPLLSFRFIRCPSLDFSVART